MSVIRPKAEVNSKANLKSGFGEIVFELNSRIAEGCKVIAIELYPPYDEAFLQNNLLNRLNVDVVINSEEIFFRSNIISERIKDNLTDDRIYGVMSHYSIEDFIDKNKFKDLESTIDNLISSEKTVVIYGVGVALFDNVDLVIYSDLTRWEIQLRYRSGEFSNWKANNSGEDVHKMIKRGYFFEWRVMDRLKRKLFAKIDYFLNLENEKVPLLLDRFSYLGALKEISKSPFSVVPFFDSGIWGGTWLQNTFEIRKDEKNLAWCFNCVPEENSLIISFTNGEFEIPANNIIFLYPEEILGPKVYGRFGAEFPIRFNLLDTMGGQNLSLQVHPKVDYIQNVFGAHYTQDESYYILDSMDDAIVYLGVNEGVSKGDLFKALEIKSTGEKRFDENKYINQIEIKKHDHFSIPSGTIHSSGKNSVVLEISATPNRFTMKLWDWERVDLDGKPRPVHLNHGKENVDIYKDTVWVNNELVNKFILIREEEGWEEIITGLHETEFIETRRHKFNRTIQIENHNSVNVICLVEGEKAVIKSIDGSFSPYTFGYTQPVIIPENISGYCIEPVDGSDELMVIQAFVR